MLPSTTKMGFSKLTMPTDVKSMPIDASNAPNEQPPPTIKNAQFTKGVSALNTSNIWSVWSVFSVLSVASMVSLLSFGSVASATSLFSVGSIGSMLSIASTGSLLSIGSMSSTLSIASSNCFFEFGKICSDREPLHEITHSWEIHYSASAWDEAAACTQEMYQMDERPSECDYKTVKCVVNGMEDSNCDVRRKGTSTWRSLSDKPSFKIKLDDKYTAGVFPCLNGVCPPGETENEWRTKKFTLNNQVIWDGDIDAYNVYRSYIPASLATQVTVALYRDDVLQSNQTYAMVENVNDKAFVEKWFGEDTPFRLYEVELRVSKFERGGGVYDDSVDPAVVNAAPRTTELGLNDVNITNALLYRAASEFTTNTDSACGNNNNYYLLHDNKTWYHIPWGTDQAFHTKWWWWTAQPFELCRATNECMRDQTCDAQYAATLNEMQANDDFRKGRLRQASAVSPPLIIILSVLVPLILTAAILVGSTYV